MDVEQMEYNQLLAQIYVNELGLQHQQDKGQRITLVHQQNPYSLNDNHVAIRALDAPPHESETEVFIGKLPLDAYENELIPMFSLAGPIYKVRIPVHFSGATRGYAYIQYWDNDSRQRAIKMLSNTHLTTRLQDISSKPLAVLRSTCNRRLYIKNLPANVSVKQLFAEIQFILETNGSSMELVFDIREIDVREAHGQTFAHIEFATHWAAAQARRVLVPIGTLFGRRVTFDWAKVPSKSGSKSHSNLRQKENEKRFNINYMSSQ